MKNKMLRKVDAIGRIVIPREMRLALDIHTEDDVEITLENGIIILKKAEEEKR